MPYTSREVRLAARPDGEPRPADFELAEVEVPEPAAGELVVRNAFMSVDPYMRGRMDDRRSYVPPFRLGEPLSGGAVGEVVASRAPGLAAGDAVLHDLGWREYARLPAAGARKVDTSAAPPSAYLGVLGMPGFTAYVGLLDVAALRDGDVVFVSAAAGAVGSLAGQIAKLRGHTVIGSAGSPEKVAHVRDELGFDVAFDYHYAPVFGQLRRAAPDGIDVYFDNVGGDHLEAAIGALRRGGRVALCGAISNYNTPAATGIRNLGLAIGKRLQLRGFIVSDHADRRPAFEQEVGAWVREGRVKFRETIVDGGVDAAPQAFIDLLRGANVGKMVVRL
ncbi:MAG TPA: NADP-dependent oxidoreductase [Solirubrobacteraceae bacterium]